MTFVPLSLSSVLISHIVVARMIIGTYYVRVENRKSADVMAMNKAFQSRNAAFDPTIL